MPAASKLWTISGAAREVGMEPGHLWQAVYRGGVKRYDTADGKPLVRLEDSREYAENRRRRTTA